MIFEGTYYGMGFGLVVAVYLGCAIWSQRRFGGFRRHVFAQTIFLALVAHVTISNTNLLSDDALQILLASRKHDAHSIDALRPLVIPGFSARIIIGCGMIFTFAAIAFMLSALKFKRLARERAAKECRIAKPE